MSTGHHKELSTWQQVKSKSDAEDTETLHSRLWYQHTGRALAALLFYAGYSGDAQYRSLLFFKHLVAPHLGCFPIPGHTQLWQSFMTDNGSPVELSWDWGTDGRRPTVRYSIEPIGLKAGTILDPLNMLVGPIFRDHLAHVLPKLQLEWFHHFQDFFLSCRDSCHGPVDLQDHNASIFYAFDLTETETIAKVYFFPKYRAIADNDSPLNVLIRAIESAPYTTNENLKALSVFSEFAQDYANAGLEFEMLAIDLINPLDSRFKIYFRSRDTDFDSVVNIMTFGGRADSPHLRRGLQSLKTLWNSLFAVRSSCPLKEVPHRTAGMLYNLEFRLDDEFPAAKIYLPVRHYSSDDAAVIQGLDGFFQSHGRGSCMKAYKSFMATIYGSESLRTGSSVHTYIGCSIRGDGTLRVVSYFKLPLPNCLTFNDDATPISQVSAFIPSSIKINECPIELHHEAHGD
ncbi:tryptophan dimethylallyltransferase-domain-containing protein [Astrocystis sublimbata]|nr:tryptophan dimethylallyltransferase-domain-containing protein [Astrocystis sublimbata]